MVGLRAKTNHHTDPTSPHIAQLKPDSLFSPEDQTSLPNILSIALPVTARARPIPVKTPNAVVKNQVTLTVNASVPTPLNLCPGGKSGQWDECLD